MIPAFINISFIDLLDIVLVAFIIYQLYYLLRGTVAIKIFVGLLVIYLLWKLVTAVRMEMLGEILGQFIGVGVIALIIVFQQELRQFLLFIGNRKFFNKDAPAWLIKLFPGAFQGPEQVFEPIVVACENMSKQKTGALLVISGQSDPSMYTRSGIKMDALLSSPLLESIFFKNSPLHDGAVIIKEDRIVMASSVLPMSEQENNNTSLGMRHRSALGISEITDALCIVVSEESGQISVAQHGNLEHDISSKRLNAILNTRA